MGGSSYGQSILLAELDTYRVEASGRLLSSDDGSAGFGISFNYNESPANAEGKAESDFLLFLVYDRGAFTVLRYLDGQTSKLYVPTKTRLFKSGESVDMAVEAVRGQLAFFINGVQVAALREDRLLSGGFGLFTTARSISRFDDFKVYAAAPEQPDSLRDDFSARQSLYVGEVNGVHYSYEDARYIIDTTGTEYAGLSPFPRQSRDVEFSVDVEQSGGVGRGGCGIYVRDQQAPSGAYNQFRLLVSGGWFAVEQSKDDLQVALSDWQESDAIKVGGINRLSVRAEGNQLTFYVNGRQVYQLRDESPGVGAYGLYAAEGIRAAFDNAQATPLPGQ
jgi:hypothetical protein